MDADQLKTQALAIVDLVVGWATSPEFYAQAGLIAVALLIAYFFTSIVRRRSGLFTPPEDGVRGYAIRQFVCSVANLLFPLLLVTALAVAAEAALPMLGRNWLIKVAQSAAVVYLLYALITRFITNPMVRSAAIWIGLPLVALKVFGHFDEFSAFLDGMSLEAGNIRISIYFLFKALIAGGVLFWLGRLSSKIGQNIIRGQESLAPSTRELFAKLFEIALYCLVFVILLQIMGLDLTALTVFGGALGVGLGFGLQQ